MITHADALEQAALDTDIFSSRTSLGISQRVLQIAAEVFPDGMPDRQAPTIMNSDPPEHASKRTLVNRAFTPRAVQAYAPVIREIVSELLDEIAQRGKADIASEFSQHVSARVIAHLLGMSQDFPRQLADFIDARLALYNNTLDESAILRYAYLHKTYCDQLLAHIQTKLANPAKDLTSAFAAAYTERYGPCENLSAELFPIMISVVLGGQETTANLISNVIHQLASRPELGEMLDANPESIPLLVEESIRHRPPVLGTYRVATRETTIQGVTIPAGGRIKMAWSSGSRDSNRFPNPDEFHPNRPNGRSHLSFGSGIHFCVGAPLARLEAEIAVEQVLCRLPSLRLDPHGLIERTDNPLVWGLTRLEVIWETT
ncbi:cytochrome P450 [Streptomyces sp. NPDC093595]|uniref:cytochrome P450 n=1 Tax=Streptomyces sp. NPDC093595 TaxID=3366045 RepID=UPI00380507E2